MKAIIFLLMVVLITSTNHKPDTKPYLEVKFYCKGKMIRWVDISDYYSTSLPTETRDITTGRILYSDSVTVKIIK